MERIYKNREVNVQKAALFAIVVNAMEIGVLVLFVLYVIFMDITGDGRAMLQTLAVGGAIMASWGAMLDIRQALSTRRRAQTIEELEHTNTLMDTLNHKLRAQRHDFLNHLQVVYSLLEMQEYRDATDYLEKVYGEMRTVSSALRTKSTAVNALLQVKGAACEEKQIAFVTDIRTTLENMPMPGWELCCILSNLLDNAMDATEKTESPSVGLEMSEELRGFTFVVRNNGAPIPEALREQIFEAGLSTKGEGRGMGLHIVRETLGEHGGTISLDSGPEQTAFTVFVPRQAQER